jgi:pimeloyl-ACP methyl ester carboxylesterase
MAAAPRVFAQQAGQGGTAMGTYEKGAVRIHFEEAGSGFPLLLIAGGGLNSTISNHTGSYPPFNAIEQFKGEYRCIALDLRNANAGQSSGPLEIDRPWDSHTDDQLGLMDHLGIDKFMVLGFCIGGPMIWNLLRRAPDRIVAGVLAQPSGSRPEMRDLFYDNNMKGWGPELTKRRPDVTMEMVDKFLTRMYRTNPDFVFTVTRDFVRQCQTPVLILPDDIPAHPYAVAMEAAMLAPKAEVSMFPWKEPKERIPLAIRQIRSFLRAHLPA